MRNRSEFTYDGLSRMVKIVEKTGGTINSTRKFVWHGQEKLEFRDAADAVTMRIFPQGQHNGTTPYFFTRDHLGSVREVLNGGGTVVARYDYDPFGRSTTILGTTPTDMNFTGLYRHSKSNLDLAVFRAYDPDLGRWLNRDPLKDAELSQGPNLYPYVHNKPVKTTDPLGLFDGESSRVDPYITGPGHDPRLNWNHNRTVPVSPSKLERCALLCSKALSPSTVICAVGCGAVGPWGWWPCFRTTTLGVTAVRVLCIAVCTAGPD